MRGRLAPFNLLLALLLISIGLSFATPFFLTSGNLINIARQSSINGILAIGVTYVLLTGGVDLSVGSVLALSGVVAARLAQAEGSWAAVAVAAGILTGAACGLVNGVIITRGRVAPFIVTLGMMVAARGLTRVVSEGKPVSDLSDSFNAISSQSLLGIPYPVLIVLCLGAGSYLVLRQMRIGRYIYAVGGNELATRASGVNVPLVKLFAYVVSGACAGLAGVVVTSRATSGTPTAGLGAELDAIAAAVIGGTSLSGGAGGVGGTMLGVLLLGVINNGQDLLGVSPYYRDIVQGCIIIAAVLMDRRQARG